MVPCCAVEIKHFWVLAWSYWHELLNTSYIVNIQVPIDALRYECKNRWTDQIIVWDTSEIDYKVKKKNANFKIIVLHFYYTNNRMF